MKENLNLSAKPDPLNNSWKKPLNTNFVENYLSEVAPQEINKVFILGSIGTSFSQFLDISISIVPIQLSKPYIVVLTREGLLFLGLNRFYISRYRFNGKNHFVDFNSISNLEFQESKLLGGHIISFDSHKTQTKLFIPENYFLDFQIKNRNAFINQLRTYNLRENGGKEA